MCLYRFPEPEPECDRDAGKRRQRGDAKPTSGGTMGGARVLERPLRLALKIRGVYQTPVLKIAQSDARQSPQAQAARARRARTGELSPLARIMIISGEGN